MRLKRLLFLTVSIAALSLNYVYAASEVIDHTIVAGDTLWDICKTYVGDPFQWPEIMKNNPSIQDPDLIQPGNVVHILLNDEKKIESISIDEREIPDITPTKIQAPKSTDTIKTIKINLTTFLVQKPYKHLPHILTSKHGAKNYSAGDTIFIAPGKSITVTNGNRYPIVKFGEKIGKLGYRVEKKGIVKIIDTNGHDIKGIVEECNAEIEPDDILVTDNDIPPNAQVTLKPFRSKINGEIIKNNDDRDTISQNDIVFINVGKHHGLSIGDVLAIERPVETTDDETTVSAGSLYIADVYEKSATAIILDSFEEIHIGYTLTSFPEGSSEQSKKQ